MNKQQNLAELLLLPWDELKTYQELVSDIVSLRARLEPAAEPPSVRPALAPQQGPGSLIGGRGLPERSPLRTPKPGSLRADIHAILESAGKPLRRSDVIRLVSTRRRVAIDDALKAKVGDQLTNRHDPFIRKIAQGIYQYVPQTTGGVL